jgi:hypothetical protein
MGGATEVVVANTTSAVATSEMPEAQVDGLFGGPEIGKDCAQEFWEIHGVGIACEWGEREKGRGQPMISFCLCRRKTAES